MALGLLPISGCERSGGSAAPVSAQWLIDATDEAALDFVHESGAAGNLLLPEIMGGGAALFDYDDDGDLDIYLTNGNGSAGGGTDSHAPRNRLYRQEASGGFVDATGGSGLGDPGYGMGVAVGDIDNDGDLDVYLTNYGLDRLFRNRGDGTFEDATAAATCTSPGTSGTTRARSASTPPAGPTTAARKCSLRRSTSCCATTETPRSPM
jgi:hypothetical protein